ncbi:uncharacterized protein BO88DRAFT_22147 [Aspergillus vadensis CBS 113365]|uniref:Uncharacterized protein n=1 Tax=Aspergillus vadensis (strain CBS 113365 / IMI 142717 / IBT 24658) TaxID=1448311 RepID=A0A319CHH8_ASPVC|nr:hypothetical protein BO88DRAFT_22147 [Aspergillus vadensis CBS 113365]PYH74768.1 hypothetical protein BO88DRAFT_22147 [Aspergillus vadensis CBS 113365]
MQHSSEDSIRNRNCSISKGECIINSRCLCKPVAPVLRMIRIPAAVSPPLHTNPNPYRIFLSQLGNGWWIIMLSVHAQRQPRNATSTRSLKTPDARSQELLRTANFLSNFTSLERSINSVCRIARTLGWPDQGSAAA